MITIMKLLSALVTLLATVPVASTSSTLRHSRLLGHRANDAAPSQGKPTLSSRKPLLDLVHSEFAELSTAVGEDDAQIALEKAEQLASRLREEVKRRSKTPAAAQAPNSNASLANVKTSAKAPAVVALHSKEKAMHEAMNGQCALDDKLFSLTAESKWELWQELDTPSMQEAVKWVRTGGWWVCGMQNDWCTCKGWWVCGMQNDWCTCKGWVRLTDTDITTEAQQTVDARNLPGNAVWCDVSSFGGVDPRPGSPKQCECRHNAAQIDEFHLHKRLTSSSLLQEAWIFLLRLLGRASLLPAGTHDRLYHGIENWAQRRLPSNTPLVLERVWIEMFVKKVVQPSTTGLNRCLEWGDPARPGYGFNYLNMMPQCTDKVDIQFDGVYHGRHAMGMEGNVVYSDIEHLPHYLSYYGDHRIGIIFATQVFEHLADPKRAAGLLFHSLLPGGALVFTAPQQAQFHMVPHDYFRYTKEGALQVLQDAGFCVPSWGFAGGGDFVFDMARDAGLQVQDFPDEELKASFQIGYDKVSHSAITIHALAYKPPHAACHSPATLPRLY
eukprot:gnl/TRDRNA2_/TRDRNA2_150793_c0_seq1.p1 gnl/TRDRNA2_/TRDRNA2_150793_c0~~gnl/TRDRNA2_/TRDRNA2_150793_c0_seq1.p1  ORF type:complete len:554 (+),score=89.38 gnl/TRDRNA2_/TRDRNA2_150793_c0_seq1:89-1750(+)